MTRTRFLKLLSNVGVCHSLPFAAAQSGRTFRPWTPGSLDIHHISTGRGNSTLVIAPDGTSMMVDAGATTQTLQYTITAKPNSSRRPGEWVARYAARHLKAAGRDALDYFLLTHFHGDHMGQLDPSQPMSKQGNYRLTGVADVAEMIHIARFLDRDYPAYNYPVPLTDESSRNYIECIRARVRRGAFAERFKPGSATQVRLLRKPADYPSFLVRNLAANGEVWTGAGDSTRHQFPKLSNLSKEEHPTENMCCLALRLSYGKFDYYTGGDLYSGIENIETSWRDIESPVAHVAGPVEVAVANHHGYADAIGPDFVRSLRPRAFIIMAWDSAHPAIAPLLRMLSRSLYPEERDIYTTAMKPENKIVNRRLAELKSENGHVVVRVSSGGNEFRIVILDNSNESDQVVAEFGPWPTT